MGARKRRKLRNKRIETETGASNDILDQDISENVSNLNKIISTSVESVIPVRSAEANVELSLQTLLHRIVTCPPAFVRHLYSSSEHRDMGITLLKAKLGKYMDKLNLKSCKQIHYILKKLNCNMNGPFRRHKYFQAMRGALKNVERIEAFNVQRICSQFHDAIVLDAEDSLYAPSAEILEHMMVCVIVVSRLLCTTLRLCTEAGSQSAQQLQIQHFVPPNLILLGTVSQLRGHCATMLTTLSQLYFVLQPFLQILRRNLTGKTCGILFKPNLAEMSPEIQEAIELTKRKASTTQKQTYIQFFEKLLDYKDKYRVVDWKNETKVAAIQNVLTKPLGNTVDLGVAVSRNTCERKDMTSFVIFELNSAMQSKQFKAVFKLIKSHISHLQEELKSDKSKNELLSLKKTLRVFKKCKIVFKSRWPSIIALKSQANDARMKDDMNELKIHIVNMLKEY